MLKNKTNDNNSGRLMKVANAGFLTMRLGQECAPQQELRELTQNGIEAIQRNPFGDKRGRAYWCMYPKSMEKYGVAKLCCIDTGRGMSARQLEDYIGDMSNSSEKQDDQGNFGVGAKISSLENHPAGVVYETWQNGTGHRLTLFVDEDNHPRLKQVGRTSSKVVEKLDLSEMPRLIEQSGGTGTMVILLGRHIDEDTLQRPIGYDEAKKGQWLAWTLNRRYYQIPDGIEVLCNSTSAKNPTKWTKVTGMQWFLAKHAKQSGVLELADADIHWYLLKHNKTYTADKPLYDSGAKVGVWYQDELYDFQSAVSAQNKLQHHFGIPVGANQIALIIKPHHASPNLSRSTLTFDKKPLPWDRWSEEFRKNMPSIIRRHIRERQADPSGKGKPTKLMMDFLRTISKSRVLQADPAGRSKGGKSMGVAVTGSSPATTSASGSNSSADPSKSHSSSASSIERLGEGKEKSATRRNLQLDNLLPSYIWGRGSDLGMDGTFAKYINNDNQLLLNQDCKLVKEVVDYWVGEKDPEHREAVVEKVHEHFAAQAGEVVIVLQKVAGTSGWEQSKITEMLEDSHALSLAATSRLYMHAGIKTSLSTIPNRPKIED